MVLLLAASICGIATAALVIVFADTGNEYNAKMARCFMGFAVAMIWIMAIADEVVNVLDVSCHPPSLSFITEPEGPGRRSATYSVFQMPSSG